MDERAFQRFAGWCAILAAGAALLYSVSFVIALQTNSQLAGLLAPLFLAAGGLLSTAALLGVFGRVRTVAPAFALWALLFGAFGAVGSAVHGGFDLANAINPPPLETAGLPSEIDPRGLLTFGFSGIAVLGFSWLVATRPTPFSGGLGRLGLVLGALLVVIYLGRLIVLDPTNPLVIVPAGLAGVIVGPLWYAWVGRELLRGG